jgi:hypothetical protein
LRKRKRLSLSQHVLISGHIVLLNRKTNLIVDVFPF